MESKQGTLTDLFSQKKENTVLYAPKQVFASQALYPDSISLSWTTVDGATSYRIEKAIVKPQPDGTYNLPEESDFNKASIETQIQLINNIFTMLIRIL